MFKSIFKPRWQHHDPAVRMSAVDNLDDQSIVVGMVNNDPDAGVRSRALASISEPGLLDQLIGTLPAPLAGQARAQRLSVFFPGKDDIGAQLGRVAEKDALIHIAELTDNEALRAQAIGQLDDVAKFDLANHHALAAIRLDAARQISNMAQLNQLTQQARGRDKALYRYCKSRVDADKSKRKAEAELKANLDAVIDRARDLSTAADSPEYKSLLQSVKSRWAVLESDASQEQRVEMAHFLDHCGERLARKLAQALADQEREQASDAALIAFTTIVEATRSLDASTEMPDKPEAAAKLARQLDDLERRWLAALRHGAAPSGQAKEFQQLHGRWHAQLGVAQSLLKRAGQLKKHAQMVEQADAADYRGLSKLQDQTRRLLKDFSWPGEGKQGMPAAISLLQQNAEDLDSRLNALRNQQDKHLERFESSLHSLRTAVEAEQVKEANRALSRLRQASKTLSPEAQERFQQELRGLIARVNEFRDWQGFAIEPKKIDLCARMSGLIGSSEAPDVLASRIKALQQEWKGLGATTPARDQALWKDFSEAADRAFEPCREYFAAQGVLREENLEGRMQLVAQLDDYENKMHWPTEASSPAAQAPDWKMVQQTLDAARSAFRELSPVSHKGEKQSQKLFRQVCDRIYAHIKEEYQRNISAKEVLVQRAEALHGREDTNEAITQAKRLQAEWKYVGMTPVKVDKSLWQQFRTACNAVFGRLDEEKAQQRAESDALSKQADLILQQAKAALDQGDEEERIHLSSKLAELRQTLDALGLPEYSLKRYSGRFHTLEDKAQEIIGGIRSRQRQERWQGLAKRMLGCSYKSADEKKAAALWDQNEKLPRGVDAQVLEGFWEQGPNNDPKKDPKKDAKKDATEASRDLCIAMEILLGLESPVADRQARMDFQVRRMQEEGLGGAVLEQPGDQLDSVLDLINRFIALRPAPQMAERFCACLASIELPAD